MSRTKPPDTYILMQDVTMAYAIQAHTKIQQHHRECNTLFKNITERYLIPREDHINIVNGMKTH